MSETSVTFVPEDVAPADVDAVAARVLAALIEMGVVLPDPIACALGDDLAYPPGPGADAFQRESADILRDCATRGLEILRGGRHVFWNTDYGEVTCPACGGHEGLADAWFGCVNDWSDGEDNPTCTCPTCARSASFRDYRLESPFGFGYLGFKFWNWYFAEPEATAAWFAERTGSRVVVVDCRL